MAHAVEVEIERNYAAFREMVADLLPTDEGRYALLHAQRLEGLFASAGDAARAAYRQFADQPFSIQRVTNEPVDLGFFSYALADR